MYDERFFCVHMLKIAIRESCAGNADRRDVRAQHVTVLERAIDDLGPDHPGQVHVAIGKSKLVKL
jgi:hypothetical protein